MFRLSTVGALATGLALVGPMSFLPAQLQRSMGLDPLLTAVIFGVWSGTSFVVPLLRRPAGRPAALRRDVFRGMLLVAAGYVFLLGLAGSGAWPRALPGMVVSGVGLGLLNMTLARLAVESVPVEHAALSSGANNTARYVGSALGMALISAISASVRAGAGADATVVAGALLALLGVGLAIAAGRSGRRAPGGA